MQPTRCTVITATIISRQLYPIRNRSEKKQSDLGNILLLLENLNDYLGRVAGAVRLELTTVGFGDRCSTIRTMPL